MIKTLPGQKSSVPESTYAEFSEDRIYRYSLRRVWKLDGRLVNWIMMNPSIAGEVYNDPTINKCIKYTESWGYDGILVTNLFAVISSDPRILKKVRDPVGPENDQYILKYVTQCDLVVCAWGNPGSYLNRGRYVMRLLKPFEVTLNCLARTKSGEPGHPLYLKGNLQPQIYEIK